MNTNRCREGVGAVASRCGQVLALSVMMLTLSACASTGPVERAQQRLALYQSATSEPVKSFHFWTMHNWEPLGREHLAVWTRLDRAFLIEVRPPCSGLDFTQVVAITSTQNRVYRDFDSVRFDTDSCRIGEIWPVDVEAFRKAEKAARAEATPG